MIIPVMIITIARSLVFVSFSLKIRKERRGTKRYDNDSMILTSLSATPWLIAKIFNAIQANITAYPAITYPFKYCRHQEW